MREAGWMPAPRPGWSKLRLKSIVSSPVVRADDKAYPFIALEHIRSGLGAVNTDFEWSPSSSEDCVLFKSGDVLFGKLRPYLRKYLLADRDGCCQGELLVLRPRSDSLSARFLFYVVQSEAFIAWADAASYGVKMPRTSWEVLSTATVLLPSGADQDSICAFLDRETARIDALIEKKRRLIALLEEKRAALINRAVTRGLDPAIPLRDSGLAWFGDIPAHWGILPFRRVVLSMCDGPFGSDMKSSHYAEIGVRLIRLQNIGSGEFDDSDRAYIPEHHFCALPGHDAVPGDLLVAGLGDANHPVGRACVLPPFISRAMVKADCFRLRLNEKRMLHRYAALFLSSAQARSELALLTRGATRDRVNLGGLVQARVPCPPLHEQLAIVSATDEAATRIVKAETLIRNQVARIAEYRTALISAAVTGKIDVRDRAALHAEAAIGQ